MSLSLEKCMYIPSFVYSVRGFKLPKSVHKHQVKNPLVPAGSYVCGVKGTAPQYLF